MDKKQTNKQKTFCTKHWAVTTTKKKKKKKRIVPRENRAGSTERRGGRRKRENWECERVRESLKAQTFKHAVITQHKPGVSIQPTAITQRITVIK